MEPVFTRRTCNRMYSSRPYAALTAYKGSFLPSTVRLWNGLPANVISALTLEDFKLLVGADILNVNNKF